MFVFPFISASVSSGMPKRRLKRIECRQEVWVMLRETNKGGSHYHLCLKSHGWSDSRRENELWLGGGALLTRAVETFCEMEPMAAMGLEGS